MTVKETDCKEVKWIHVVPKNAPWLFLCEHGNGPGGSTKYREFLV
jgi:hypothetical protein